MDNINTNNTQQNSDNTESFAELFSQSIQNVSKEGTVVSGQIISIDRDAVLVDVGLKSEGRIPLKEFMINNELPKLEVGEYVDIYIERFEGKSGRTILSREKALREEAWSRFEDLHKQNISVEGRVIGRVKGGFAVDIGGLIAFLPGSQVDIRPVKDIAVIMNIYQPFKILKMDREQGNVVVSRRVILEESRMEARDELLSGIVEGAILEGTVKNITDYGAFLDLGAHDGLLHITDISWNKIAHPSEILHLGQRLKVMVIKYNVETKRISLGLKQLEKNPWESLSDVYKVGTRFKGTISSIADYGAFVEVAPNIEGLVYHTEISWNAKNVHPKKLLKPGDEVEVMVLEIDIEKHRIGLSMKRCKDNPWQKFSEEHPIGSVVTGVVKNIADFGVFVVLNENDPERSIDALIPAVEISWDENAGEKFGGYKKGDVVTGVVLTTDIDRERVTIGLKQLTDNHAEGAMSKLEMGSILTCTVSAIKTDGIDVELSGGAKSFIKKSELSKHRAEQKPERFAVGDRVDVMVTSSDKKTHKCTLSIKALEVDQEKRAIAEYGSTDSGASLGEILGAAFNQANNSNQSKE
ncbi:30S ribosomal protein S1 [Rickettsiales endosymbiont of Peranema trichophorum]|uniref:30S ribosomal protein S1 n=1 Tax=Rickettsiales endosymbiont of Peranema trichophorum TaxID=2486577 RepID=UPI0010230671|nr:30S ribosomal protein S1 [Rickettsiales endosymbiont of Peranema trichophorum]RZI47192.1 30S ribosomal protein S1 [Rickettsiales endosymbiont of Peranema trichophorum]